MRGWLRQCAMFAIILGHFSCRTTIYWGIKLNAFSVMDNSAHRKEIRLGKFVYLAFDCEYMY